MEPRTQGTTGIQPLTIQEDVRAVSGVSFSKEDEAPSSPRHQQPLRKVLKHRTPQEASPSPHRRPASHVPSHPREAPEAASPSPTPLSWKRLVPQAGLSSMAALQTLRLPNISASGVAGGQPGPNPEPPSPEEDPPAPATVTWQQHQIAGAHGEGSWPQSSGLPGIPNMAGRRRRDLKKLEAVAERERQWEIRLLQDIEEATQHELTVEDDCPLVLGPGAVELWSAHLGLTDSSGPPSVRPSVNPSPPQGLLKVPTQLTRLWAAPPEHRVHREQEPAGDVGAYSRGARHPTSFPRATQGTG